MPAFDRTKPIDDPTVWYPKGQYARDSATYRRDGSVRDGKNFVLAKATMIALNKHARTGCHLATTTLEYARQLDLDSLDDVSDNVWEAIDKILGTYEAIHVDCFDFLEKDGSIWSRIVDFALHIHDFSADVLVENKLKFAPMEGDVEIKRDAGATTAAIALLRDKIRDVRGDLVVFHNGCRDNLMDLRRHEITMERVLKNEYDNLGNVKEVLHTELGRIHAEQIKVDAEKQWGLGLDVRLKAPLILILADMYQNPIIGCISGANMMVVDPDADVHKLQGAMQRIKEVVYQDDAKTTAVNFIQGDITSTKVRFISQLVKYAKAAITTLEELEESWDLMAADVDALAPLAGHKMPIALEGIQIAGILRKWNKLYYNAGRYLEHGYLEEEPKDTTIDAYLEGLEEEWENGS